MDNEKMRWRARLKRDVKLTSAVFRCGTIVYLTRDVRGRTHLEGYPAATIADKDWTLVWDDYGLQKILGGDSGHQQW